MHETWLKIQELVGATLESYGTNRITWFRGQGHNWPLLPKLHRRVLQQNGDAAKPEQVRARAHWLYAEFKRHAWSLLRDEDRSPWGVVCAMQHYGIETRFLDWTENFACAVYFALADAQEKGQQPTIYILDPIGLNRHSGISGVVYLDDAPLDPDPTPIQPFHPVSPIPVRTGPLAVCPLLANSRMRAQRACFTIAPDDYVALDQIPDHHFLGSIAIPPEALEDARRFVSLSGMTRHGVFPDFEGLAGHFDDLTSLHEAGALRLKKLIDEAARNRPRSDDPPPG